MEKNRKPRNRISMNRSAHIQSLDLWQRGMLKVELWPHKIYIEVLTPGTSERDLIWEGGGCRCSQFTQRLTGVWWALSLYTGVLIREAFDHRHRHVCEKTMWWGSVKCCSCKLSNAKDTNRPPGAGRRQGRILY